jgi:peptidoglycan/xylan/chitin deacetylase (PgdA/CDA1 family)
MKAILTYHSIDASQSPISISASAFAEHARWFTSGRVRVLSLDDLIAHPPDGPDAVALTFDDGFANIGDAVTSLAAAGVQATVFVVTGEVGATNDWGGRPQTGIPTMPLLGWADLERMAKAGVRLEAHTRTHPHLTRVPADMLDAELAGCREDLRARLGLESHHLAYPYGDVDAAVVTRAGAQYRFGYTTEFRVLRGIEAEASLRLPRIDMYYFRSPGAIQGWGSPAFARRLAWIRTRRFVRSSFPIGRRS